MLDQFGPITSTIGFLERRPDALARDFLEWTQPNLLKYGARIESRPVEGKLEQVMYLLLPLTSPIRERFLFLETNSRWTAFFDNFWKGTDAATPIHYLSERLECRGIRITSIADQSREDAGTILEICQGTGERRTIFCAKDGAGWKFGMSGDPLPFEEMGSYDVKCVRDRFNPEVAEKYLRALGIEVSAKSFYEPNGRARGFLLTRRGKRPDTFREHTTELAHGTSSLE